MALDFSKRPKRTTKRTPKAKELEGSCEEIQSHGCADASEKDVVHSLMGPSTISKVKIHDSGDQSKRAVLHAIEGSASTLRLPHPAHISRYLNISLLAQIKSNRSIMKKQFPTEPFDLQVFTQKANQKCRDAATMHGLHQKISLNFEL
ncbi:hypothetical protein EMCRGX_G021993 [Ephydatia muelleri]